MIYSILPTPCINCNKVIIGKRICDQCYEKILAYDFPECHLCRLLSIDGNTHKYCISSFGPELPRQCIYSYVYNSAVKRIIINAKKYKYEFSLLNILLSHNCFIKSVKLLKDSGIDLIIPIPMNNKNERDRLQNHSEIISKKISKILNVKYASNILKYANFSEQKELTRDQRLHKANRLSLNKKAGKLLEGKVILIVDDVITSGKTINDASTLLSELNPKKICAYALARPIMYNNSINYANI